MLALLSMFILTFVNIIVIFSIKNRKTVIALALVALLPLFLGLTATVTGYTKIDQMVKEEEGTVSQKKIQQGRANARFTTYLGAGGTVFLWMILAASLAIRNAKTKTSDARRGNNENGFES